MSRSDEVYFQDIIDAIDIMRDYIKNKTNGRIRPQNLQR